ncbi:MAG: hypothetical protein QOF53_1988, partial [Nocardioidaceae bacterium]|nr:hypothetical protein [Nocardioidaceae bacterium]
PAVPRPSAEKNPRVPLWTRAFGRVFGAWLSVLADSLGSCPRSPASRPGRRAVSRVGRLRPVRWWVWICVIWSGPAPTGTPTTSPPPPSTTRVTTLGSCPRTPPRCPGHRHAQERPDETATSRKGRMHGTTPAGTTPAGRHRLARLPARGPAGSPRPASTHSSRHTPAARRRLAAPDGSRAQPLRPALARVWCGVCPVVPQTSPASARPNGHVCRRSSPRNRFQDPRRATPTGHDQDGPATGIPAVSTEMPAASTGMPALSTGWERLGG